MQPVFFARPEDLRVWFETHHTSSSELWVGYFKRASGRRSITWPESVDEALCYGWIDGVRKRYDDESYVIRFSPRRRGSAWSRVNIGRAEELIREGRMHPAGLAAFQARTEANYSHEQRSQARLEPTQEARFRANPEAWDYFLSRPPSYQRTAIWWVVSAKKEETRERRLTTLIEDSANRRTIAPLAPRPG
ncbi:MAG TPA: YdeI/OmpD-associated family protein [Actinomycetota bacterium]|jgi:uncharacterized protein YdeI (YjbR/CyaY-like superfamily)